MSRSTIVSGAAGVIAAGTIFISAAFAAPPITAPDRVQTPGQTHNAQFIFGDQEYCWYLDGWNGPGWYWCGYAWRRGFGWGGVRGWRSWAIPNNGRRGWGGRPGRPDGYAPRGRPNQEFRRGGSGQEFRGGPGFNRGSGAPMGQGGRGGGHDGGRGGGSGGGGGYSRGGGVRLQPQPAGLHPAKQFQANRCRFA